MPAWVWGLYLLVGAVMVVAALAISVVIKTSLWRIVRGVLSSDQD